ncbi:MAG: dephospho-CoA kinase [Pseudomonadota bacterium]
MLVVGLTGGIGSGKSSAARIFAELGATVIDTDAIARELTAPGGGALPEIRRQFGDACFTASGELDRAALRAQVFSDTAARKRLETILHPRIRAAVAQRIAATEGAPYLILVVPLLLETGAYRHIVQRVLVVDCAETEQVARTMARSGLREEEVRAIMAAQWPRRERIAQADDVVNNNGSPEVLRQQVEALHRRYLGLAEK